MKLRRLAHAALLACFVLTTARLSAAESLDALLERVQSSDDETRLAARKEAPAVGAAAVEPLARLMLDARLDVARTAQAALEAIVHDAGRPGGVEARGPVCAELEKLLGADQDPKIKREVLHLIAHIGGDRAAARCAELLDDSDKHVRETARLALERIPGAGSTAALERALEAAADASKPEYLYSLSKKDDPGLVAVIAAYATADRMPALRAAAFEALARLATPETVAIFDRALDDHSGIGAERVWDEYLRLADGLQHRVDTAHAAPLFRRALEGAPLAHQREHALHALAPEGSLRHLDVLIASLGDNAARVRQLARRRLARLEGSDVSTRLAAAYESAPRSVRPAILRALAQRGGDTVADVIEEAAASSEPELKVTALDLLGRLENPQLETLYLELAVQGSELIKGVAVSGCLAVARHYREAGETDRAFALLERCLKLEAADEAQRSRALAEIVATQDARALDVTTALLEDPQLANDAARGATALAASLGKEGEKERAEKALRAIARGQFPDSTRFEAVDALDSLGVDLLADLRKEGFLLDWWSTTPIQYRGQRDAATEHFPVATIAAGDEIDFEGVYNVRDRNIRWRRLRQLTTDGAIELNPLFRRSNNRLIYVYADLASAQEQPVLFKIGSDDGMACWLNGKLLGESPGTRGYELDQDVLEATLAEGRNRLLVKIINDGGDWKFSVRTTNRDGEPIQLEVTTAAE